MESIEIRRLKYRQDHRTLHIIESAISNIHDESTQIHLIESLEAARAILNKQYHDIRYHD